MSSSYSSPAPHRRSHPSRGGASSGSAAGRQRYVPKEAPVANSSASVNPNSTRSFTTSLHSSAVTAGGYSTGGVGAGLRFVDYLPADEAVAAGFGAEAGALDAVEAQKVVDFLNEKLEGILLLQPREFWREVAKNESLHEFLDSYLQFRRRWYDLPHRAPKGTIAGVVVGELDLCRRVFMVFYRISSNKEPGAASHDALSLKEHAALLQEKRLLSLPKLLDISAIYGHDNGELTSSLVVNAINAQPDLADDFSSAVFVFLDLYRTMQNRCQSSLEEITSSAGYDEIVKEKYYKVVIDVLDFVNDAVVTLDALAGAYKPAVLLFAQTCNGSEDLLSTLAGLHDSLLPSVFQGFGILSASIDGGSQKLSGWAFTDILLGRKMLLRRIAYFGWTLLEFCYLNNELTEQDVRKVNKMFPAKIDDPGIRGDIILQTLKDISNKASHENPEGTFLQVIEKEFQLLSRISSLRSKGWIYMDDEQFNYLYQLTGSTFVSSNNINPTLPVPFSVTSEKDEETAILQSKIAQIKDLFPDYGKGFLAACLEAYNENPEEVIQRILEGTIHEDLLALGTSLEQVPESKPEVTSRKDKGKGILLESGSQVTDKGKGILLESGSKVTDKGKGILLDFGSQVTTQPVSASFTTQIRDREGASSSSRAVASYGRYTRKTNDESPDATILDSMPEKDAIRSTVLASEVEYEDEYDDSFDDVGFQVESDYQETENDETGMTSTSGSGRDSSGARWSQQKTPQFFVKDGKNYSYKVSGSVAVSSAREAALVNQSQKEMIYGLGRGGNLPLAGTRSYMDMSYGVQNNDNQLERAADGHGRGNANSHGRGARRAGNSVGHQDMSDARGNETNNAEVTADGHGRGGPNNRGRGGRGGRNHYRKERAMKKHFQSLGGFPP